MDKEIKKAVKSNKTLTAIKYATLIFYILGGFVLLSSGVFFVLTYFPMILDSESNKDLLLMLGVAFSYVGVSGGILLIILAIATNIFYFYRKRKIIASAQFLIDNPELK